MEAGILVRDTKIRASGLERYFPFDIVNMSGKYSLLYQLGCRR